MFYIIELFSNNLQELFDFVVNIISQCTIISNIREKNGKFSVSTQYFRLSIYFDNEREKFDKEDFYVNINTVLWFDVLPASEYSPLIISLLESILKRYNSDIIMFNTGYDALLVRRGGTITLGKTDIPIVRDIRKVMKL